MKWTYGAMLRALNTFDGTHNDQVQEKIAGLLNRYLEDQLKNQLKPEISACVPFLRLTPHQCEYENAFDWSPTLVGRCSGLLVIPDWRSKVLARQLNRQGISLVDLCRYLSEEWQPADACRDMLAAWREQHQKLPARPATPGNTVGTGILSNRVSGRAEETHDQPGGDSAASSDSRFRMSGEIPWPMDGKQIDVCVLFLVRICSDPAGSQPPDFYNHDVVPDIVVSQSSKKPGRKLPARQAQSGKGRTGQPVAQIEASSDLLDKRSFDTLQSLSNKDIDMPLEQDRPLPKTQHPAVCNPYTMSYLAQSKSGQIYREQQQVQSVEPAETADLPSVATMTKMIDDKNDIWQIQEGRLTLRDADGEVEN